jgi:transposase-like protein
MADQDIPKSLIEVIRYFSDVDVCIEFVASLRWMDGKAECPHCGAKNAGFLKTRRIWKCRECRKQFSVKTGTIFEESPIALDKWLMAIWLVVNCKNGISSYEIARDLKVTQKSAWFMLHRIRLALQSGSWAKMGGNGGAVEVDEAYVGGKPQNMHYSRKMKLEKQRSQTAAWKNTKRYATKTAVMGMFDRESRQIRAKVVPNVRRETLQNEILNNIEHGSKLYTDQAVAYDNLKEKYIHETVNHANEYVNGQVHTNCLENFWSLMKRGLHGTYVAVEPFHLSRYIDEQVFRFNNRHTRENPLDDADRFMLAVSQISGKRLTYAELTGKVPETAF